VLVAFATILHIAVHSYLEKFSIFTILHAVFWSAFSIGIYCLIAARTDGLALAASISSVLIVCVYFIIYYFVVFPSFIELTVLGHRVIHDNTMTRSGIIYLSLASFVETVLFLIALTLSKLIRSL
jgi:hypothetical protein